MQFSILGTLEVEHDGRPVSISAPKVRHMLALLLLRANQMVSVDAAAEELWGQHPPRTSLTTVQTYVYTLRKLFNAHTETTGTEILATRSRGYILRIADEQLDALEFTARTKKARGLLDSGRPAEAAALLRSALDMWRGPTLADISVGPLLGANIVHLQEERERALELRIEADMQAGRYREVIPDLRAMISASPWNEWFHGRLMTALAQCGRRVEALETYQTARRMLKEFALEPTPELELIQRRILIGELDRGAEDLLRQPQREETTALPVPTPAPGMSHAGEYRLDRTGPDRTDRRRTQLDHSELSWSRQS